MKFLKALAIVLFGPLFGIVVAFILGSLASSPDPNFVANGGHASPGDGFQMMGFVAVSLVISVPLSIFLAGVVLFRKPKVRINLKRLEGPLLLRDCKGSFDSVRPSRFGAKITLRSG